MVSNGLIYIDNRWKEMYFDTCICEKLWPGDVLIRDLTVTLPSANR